MGRESFVFYRDWLDAIEDLEDGDKLAIILGLAKYALDGEDPKLPKHLKLAFKMVRPMIDRDIEKWEDVRAKRSEAAKASHAARAANKAKIANAAKAQENDAKIANAASAAQAAVNVNVNVNDNVGVNTQTHAPAHAGIYEESDQDTEAIREYKRYMKWCIGQGYWYADPENVQRLQDYQWGELREKYSKEQILEATKDLEGRQDYKDAHRYASHYAALRAFLGRTDKTK